MFSLKKVKNKLEKYKFLIMSNKNGDEFMKYIKPNYDESIVSLVNSIKKYFGLTTDKKTLSSVDELLKKEHYKNIILVLYDGLGYNILKRNKDICPFLNKHLYSKIASVFPPTTTAATTSVLTGVDPVVHGFLGWEMYFKDYDDVVTLFLNTSKTTGKKIDGYPGTMNLLPYEAIPQMISQIDGCLGSDVSPFGNVRYESFNLDEMNENIKTICKNGKKNFIYAYYENPDAAMHEEGVNSKKVKDVLKKIDHSFQNLCDSLEDSLILMIADHGHIDCSSIVLSDYEEIFSMLKGTTGLDSRTVSFRVKEEYLDVFPKKIKEILKDDFLLLAHDEIIREKWFGSGKKNKYFEDAIGDYVAIGIGNKCIRYDDSCNTYKSHHSGITEDEVYVPLVVVKRK